MTHQFFCFSSDKLTDIYAGCTAKLWAVGNNPSAQTRTLATKFPIGSLGIMYTSDKKQVLVPFQTTTKPDINCTITDVIWTGAWSMPFGIEPLSDPSRYLHKDDIKNKLPSLQPGGINYGRNWHVVLSVSPTHAFNSNSMTMDDFLWILEQIGDPNHYIVQQMFLLRSLELI